jgi:hypothetical protein
MGPAITVLATTGAGMAGAGGEVAVLEGTSAGTVGRFFILQTTGLSILDWWVDKRLAHRRKRKRKMKRKIRKRTKSKSKSRSTR